MPQRADGPGSPGIGKQIAVSFAAEGCRQIAIFDHSTAGLEETRAHVEAASPGVDVLPLKVDVRNEAEIVDGIARVIQRFKRIDYAINCAGQSRIHTPHTGGCLRIHMQPATPPRCRETPS